MKNNKDIWINRIQDYKASGLTAAQWCEKYELSINSLRYYTHKINKEKKQEAKQTKWASVVPTPATITEEKIQPLKITIGHSSIEVAPGFDPTTFETVVRILKEQC